MTTRVSMVSTSMPTSDTRTYASRTNPLSRIVSMTSASPDDDGPPPAGRTAVVIDSLSHQSSVRSQGLRRASRTRGWVSAANARTPHRHRCAAGQPGAGAAAAPAAPRRRGLLLPPPPRGPHSRTRAPCPRRPAPPALPPLPPLPPRVRLRLLLPLPRRAPVLPPPGPVPPPRPRPLLPARSLLAAPRRPGPCPPAPALP